MARIESEKRIVGTMIRLYCRRHEGNSELCPDCASLLNYAHDRLDHCPLGAAKPTCRLCTVHCYKPAMRDQMRKVMRWAGPRMILYHPIMAIRHLIREL